MSANVETMFSVRETPWHGLGRIVMDAPASREALELAGLFWVWCLTATALCRTKKHSSSRMTCWVRALLMKLLALCRAARRSGCWQSCRRSTSSPETK